MQSCTLSQFYTGKGDEDRAAEELNCTEVNGTEARYCAEIKRKCVDALKNRAARAQP